MLSRELARQVNGRWVSEARRRLRLVAAASKQAVVAAQLGVSEAYVGMLLAGVRRPRHDVIAKAWLLFGIEGQEWGLAPLAETQRGVGRESSTSDDERGESAARRRVMPEDNERETSTPFPNRSSPERPMPPIAPPGGGEDVRPDRDGGGPYVPPARPLTPEEVGYRPIPEGSVG